MINNKKEIEKLAEYKISEYHYQIKGKFYTVNFYPIKKSFYINGANKKHPTSYPSISFLELLADGKIDLKTTSNKKSKRKSNYKNIKIKLLKKSKNCYLCGNELTIATSTVDHRIPLSKGGSNREDNLKLACKDCNLSKANSLKINL